MHLLWIVGHLENKCWDMIEYCPCTKFTPTKAIIAISQAAPPSAETSSSGQDSDIISLTGAEQFNELVNHYSSNPEVHSDIVHNFRCVGGRVMRTRLGLNPFHHPLARPLFAEPGHGDHPVMLDAPVSGGVNGAEAGTLTFMVGGPEEAYLAAQPLFLSMGKVSIYCGGSGNGVAAKICNNLAMAVSMAGVSEAYALGQSLGITAKTLAKIFDSSSARCWSSDSYNPVPGIMEGVPSSRNYEGGFSCKLMAKDLGLASAAAQEVGFRSPLTSQVHEIYMETCGKGQSGKDFSCVFRHHYAGKDEK